MKTKPGYCPVCGKELYYESEENVDNRILYYQWRCDGCRTSGEEFFKLKYIGQNLIEYTEDGDVDYIEFENLTLEEVAKIREKKGVK